MTKTNPNLWDFLESRGVLDGSDDEIKAVKREYKKQYFLQYRRKRRTEKPEFSVGLSRKNGEYGKVAIAAKRHQMTVTRFLREATLAYLDTHFVPIMPDRVARLEQLLIDCLNEVKAIAQVKEKYSFAREEKYDAIAARIDKLERELRDLFCYPKLLEEAVAVNASQDSALRQRLLTLLSHDHQD